MQFSVFSGYLQDFEAISSRLEITARLAELFGELEKAETPQACYLLQGQLLPPYHNLELQVSIKTGMKALGQILAETQTEPEANQTLFGDPNIEAGTDEVEARYKALGDLGQVAAEVIGTYRRQFTKARKIDPLSIQQVYKQLWEIAQDNGKESQQRKLTKFVGLLSTVDELSAKFIVRITLGRLRLGFSDQTIIDALSWAQTGGKGEREALELAYQKKADIGLLAQAYLAEKNPEARAKALQHYEVEVGVPVIPALCQRLNSAAEMIEKMGTVYAEPKYDGLRVQMHLDVRDSEHPKIHTFTRNLEESSAMFPELASAVSELKCKRCILDAEAIGYDPQTGKLLPFQQTMQRKRKHGIEEMSQQIPVRFYVFDVLTVDGEELIEKPLSDRKKVLDTLFEDSATFYHSPVLETADAEVLHKFHEDQLAAGLEGVVVKQASAAYQSGRKGWSWVKMKEEEGTRGKLADTIDAIVMGYYKGRGKRAQFGLGAFLVGVLDPDQNKVLTIAKIGTGITEKDLTRLKQSCDALAVSAKPIPYVVDRALEPDVWCQPNVVVEIAADELTNSPLHSAEIALRFPRLVSFREDKSWQDATTLAEVQHLQELFLEKAK